MNPRLTAALAAARQHELEADAGCCTPAAEHRRAARRPMRERLAAFGVRRPAVSPDACCP